ncbi:hypothetical protein M0811_10057 [Anaeramoeba ignava]|uniref:Transmembrane protein n=1 Tax=Anaeramoeba ignava TaxID=1746090 RepID=A0A9Q0LHP5_ANAIG|nr:hypothetical protein M0811_10057 [Anaeramoeba ignava]
MVPFFRMRKVFIILSILGIIIGGIIVGCSIGIGIQDKDIDCDKNLWKWILVCNIFIAINAITLPFNSWKDKLGILTLLCSSLMSLFLLIWSIIGLAWATKSGIKDQCGKLYNVTLADSIIILISFLVLCIVFLHFSYLEARSAI